MRVVERRFAAYLRQPATVRTAMAVIVAAILVSVLVGGVLIRLAEPREFSNLAVGWWWALQTVTTVGYGDVTPQSAIGRAVGAVVMLESIAFISIITAAITSSFVERARRESLPGGHAGTPRDPVDEDLVARLDEITRRLDRIERALGTADEGRHRLS